MDRVLTFILPFFNVENYISDCLESIFALDTTEYKYEVVCINDCSPDGSKAIVEEYQKRYSNLRLIEHDVNKGLGGARNTGLKSAKGRYIWFVDSDDMIKSDDFSKLYQCLKNDVVDVLLFNYMLVNDKGLILQKSTLFNDSELYTGVKYVDTLLGHSFTYHLGYVWRCIYRTDYLLDKNFFFPENCYWEDTVFFPKCILLADKVRSLHNIFYQYRVNQNSISGSNFKYTAERYFQFAFYAGKDLYDFSQEYLKTDEKMANLLRIKAIGYFNSFSKSLSLSSTVEKLKFYKLINKNKKIIQLVKPEIIHRNRLLLIPLIGLLLTFIYGLLFKLKDYIK